MILRDCIFSATGSYIFRLSVSQSWLTNYSQVPYIFSERTIYFFLTDDSFMILRDRIFYAKRSYIFSEKTVFFQYFRAVYFRRPFILHRGHYIFSSKIVYFTVDPLLSLKYSLSQIFSLIEPKKWLRIFEKIFRFLANFRFFGQKFFFLNSDFSSLVDPYYIHKAFFLKGGPEKTRFLAIRDLILLRGGVWDGSKSHRRRQCTCQHMHLILRWLKIRTIQFLFELLIRCFIFEVAHFF